MTSRAITVHVDEGVAVGRLPTAWFWLGFVCGVAAAGVAVFGPLHLPEVFQCVF